MRHIVRAIGVILLIMSLTSSILFVGLFVFAIIDESFIVAILSVLGCILSLAAVSWIMENAK